MMKLASLKNKGFTLIELMLVVAIIGIALTIGIPAIRSMGTPDPMTQAIKDVVAACSNARARAILTGNTMELRIHPQEGRFEVAQAPEDVNLLEQIGNPDGTPGGASAQQPPVEGGTGAVSAPPRLPPELNESSSAQLSDRLGIEMCDINFKDCKDDEVALVRFHPNGICDQFVLVLRSDKHDFKKISLEEVTGLVEVSDLK
jgi:prepilin-type N-terminal cleavage/methylation domain-containing protein